MFRDRSDAGRRLARALAGRDDLANAIVLGVPRGGVVVAAEVAKALHAPLDVVAAAKVGSPDNPEYAIGAVSPDGVITAGKGRVSGAEVEALAQPVRQRINDRLREFRGGEPLDLGGTTAIIVDDGIATGLTIRAAAEYVQRQGAARVVIAVPVAPRGAAEALRDVADDVVVLETPATFWAVGGFYDRFPQTEDAEVKALLKAAARTTG